MPIHVDAVGLKSRRLGITEGEGRRPFLLIRRCITVIVNDKFKVKEIITHPKVGRKSQGKISRVARNYKYYIRENIKFPPSPPSRRPCIR